MKDKKFLAFSSIFFLLFIAAIVTTTLNSPISQFLRARNLTPSSANSFAIVYPQKAEIGSAKIKVSVYIRDINGTVIPNRNVKLSSDFMGISFDPSDTQLTDELGMAQFNITSGTAGIFKLSAMDVESQIAITNIPSIEFTE